MQRVGTIEELDIVIASPEVRITGFSHRVGTVKELDIVIASPEVRIAGFSHRVGTIKELDIRFRIISKFGLDTGPAGILESDARKGSLRGNVL